MSARLTFVRYKQMRWYSIKQNVKIIQSVDQLITNNEMKHKQHPGIMKPRYIEQPNWLLDPLKIIIHDRQISRKMLNEGAKKLGNHLLNRHLPLESDDYQEKVNLVKSKVQKDTEEHLSNKELLDDPQAMKIFKSITYNWEPVNYNETMSLLYAIRRSIPEYSVLYKIFIEIFNTDKSFKPTTLFDYGSGTGTVIWAASQFWVDSIKEYYCIDVSKHMNELSEYLIKSATPKIKSEYIYHRQFFPASPTTYDIVVSAYSLFELPNQKARLEVILKLWQKTNKYLVIVEQGTRAGFTIINEARDFLFNYKRNSKEIHVFSPCPHDLKCPRYTTDNTPCNFEISFLTLPIGHVSSIKKELYSYVVFKRGERPEDDVNWPRIVRPVLKRSKHVICRICTSSGKLEEHILTAWKNGKNTYRCARTSKWGDRLPFQIQEVEEMDDETTSTQDETTSSEDETTSSEDETTSSDDEVEDIEDTMKSTEEEIKKTEEPH